MVYWLTNATTGSVITGVATLTSGGAVSNWSITMTPLPGTNILAVQSEDISGGLSPLVSRTFFYKVPALFTLHKAGNGNGTFTATASVAGDTLPTNGAMLNLGETYTITAKPDPFSLFSNWVSSAGNKLHSGAVVRHAVGLCIDGDFWRRFRLSLPSPPRRQICAPPRLFSTAPPPAISASPMSATPWPTVYGSSPTVPPR